LAVIDCRVATDDGSWGDVTGDTALGSGDGSIADGIVAGAADLASQNDVFADGGGPGKAYLGAEERVGAHSGAVAYLDEIVDFDPGSDTGFADGGAVNAGVGLDFDVVFDDNRAGLQDFVPSAIGLAGEAEAVATDYDPVLEDDVIAEAAVLADDGVGVGEEVVSGTDVRVEDGMWKDGGVVADGDVVADDGVGTDMGVGADVSGGRDDCSWMDSGWVGRGAVEELDSKGEGQIGVFDAEGCGWDLRKFWFDQDSCCFGGTGEGSVFGVGDEGQIAGTGVFYAGDACDLSGGVASMEGGIEVLGHLG